MSTDPIVATGIAAVVFASTFLFGDRVHPLRSLWPDRRIIVSFGAGTTVAYVFVHLMPELHETRETFASSASATLRYEGMAIYFVALIGFLVFYGLDHLRRFVRNTPDEEHEANAFRLHLGGFAVYVGLMAYQLARFEMSSSIALFTVALALHFVGVDHTLREEHGEKYQRRGRFILAATCIAGWGAGWLLSLPQGMLALSVAFVSGAIIMNSAIMELPTEKSGRFLPFMAGGLVYGLILLPLG